MQGSKVYLISCTWPTGGSSGVEMMDGLPDTPTFNWPSDNIGKDHIGDLQYRSKAKIEPKIKCCSYSIKIIFNIILAKLVYSIQYSKYPTKCNSKTQPTYTSSLNSYIQTVFRISVPDCLDGVDNRWGWRLRSSWGGAGVRSLGGHFFTNLAILFVWSYALPCSLCRSSTYEAEVGSTAFLAPNCRHFFEG